MTDIRGIIFDKDGTLTDFRATWGRATAGVLDVLAAGDAALAARLAGVLGYDPVSGDFEPDSPSVTGPNAAIVAALMPELPHMSEGQIAVQIEAAGNRVRQVPVAGLARLFDQLLDAGYRLGVVTNDSERGALRDLAAFGLAGHVDFVAGADSGHGIKPDPGPLLQFARDVDMDPAEVLMVGDGVNDLVAGRRAGMRVAAVLTGMNPAERLAPHSDVVLPDVGHLPGWLGLR